MHTSISSCYDPQSSKSLEFIFSVSLLISRSDIKPLSVKIVEPASSLVADRRYEVLCETTGSRPNAIITFYKGKRPLRRTKIIASQINALFHF
uniref:Uncharacterized protein n=1 Tax=Phlebotomus papatasi TaxID=29031 RepID=A0A1B0DE34_PHLPP